MRFLVLLAAAPLLGAAPQAAVQPAAPMPVNNPYSRADCPETPMSLARKNKGPIVHRKLGDLPPAQAFAAVDRRLDGCPNPMTLTEARR